MQQPVPDVQTVATVSTVINDGLQIVSDYALPLLIALAGVGIVSMAVQQVFKDLLRLHFKFHQRHLAQWLEARSGRPVLDTMVMLSTGGDAEALYELPPPRMVGQVAMASRVALAFPRSYEALLRTLAGPNAKDDIDALVAGSKPSLEEERTRVAHLIERNLDALQITMASRWERKNKNYAFGVSLVVTVVAFWAYFYVNRTTLDRSVPAVFSFAATALGAGILAGFVAPIAKDLVTALQKLRR